MQTIVGPVVVTKEGGFGFDLWTSEEGLSRGFSYRIRLSRTKIRDQVPHAVSGRRDDGVQRPGRIRFGVGETVGSTSAWLRAAPFTSRTGQRRPRREPDQ